CGGSAEHAERGVGDAGRAVRWVEAAAGDGAQNEAVEAGGGFSCAEQSARAERVGWNPGFAGRRLREREVVLRGRTGQVRGRNGGGEVDGGEPRSGRVEARMDWVARGGRADAAEIRAHGRAGR